jgi:hypothetical protein
VATSACMSHYRRYLSRLPCRVLRRPEKEAAASPDVSNGMLARECSDRINRWADEQYDRVPALATDLVGSSGNGDFREAHHSCRMTLIFGLCPTGHDFLHNPRLNKGLRVSL